MAWYADLSPCDYFEEEATPYLRAVGWLENGFDFPTGSVEEGVLQRLDDFIRKPLQCAIHRGFHDCDLCQPEFASSMERHEITAKGNACLFIPAKRFLFVCPTLITHYITVHRYAPPAEFCRAVLDCPPANSDAYRKQLIACGIRTLSQCDI